MGSNVNGPSLIRTPEWLACRLGQYHLYFAHHQGRYIRMAYADALEGPWQIYGPGVLNVDQVPHLMDHIASPDVHVDEERRELRMYFHGVSDPAPFEEPAQSTCLAHSFDGITFAARPELLGASYFRVWEWQGDYYAISLKGELWRSSDGISPFTAGKRLTGLPETTRHPAVMRKGKKLWVVWTAIGDCPERIFIGWVDLLEDWTQWKLRDVQELLRPEHSWEGANMPLEPSRAGMAPEPKHELRDPAFFSENDRDYLVYSVAGEAGLALAGIEFQGEPN